MGWDRNASDDRKRAYMLKKMTSMPMLAGDALHRALEEWFQARESGREFTPEEVEQSALAILRRGYKDSRDGNWRRKSKLVHLTEHHYEDSRVDEASGDSDVRDERLQEVDQEQRCNAPSARTAGGDASRGAAAAASGLGVTACSAAGRAAADVVWVGVR